MDSVHSHSQRVTFTHFAGRMDLIVAVDIGTTACMFGVGSVVCTYLLFNMGFTIVLLCVNGCVYKKFLSEMTQSSMSLIDLESYFC